MTEPGQNSISPGRRAWLRFRRNRAAVVSAWYLIFLLLAITAWPVILKIAGSPFAQIHNPNQLSEGMEYVLVNGVPVIDQGKMTGALPGKVLRGPGYVP